MHFLQKKVSLFLNAPRTYVRTERIRILYCTVFNGSCLKKIFTSIKVVSYEELSLGANMLYSEWVEQQIKWNANIINDLQFNLSGICIKVYLKNYVRI